MSKPSFWPPWPKKTSTLPNLIPGSIVLIPYCYHPEPLEHYYRAGCKVIAANPNPLPLLAVQASLSAISAETLEATFTQLSAILKRGQHLDQFIQGLYQSACPQCKKTIPADYFVWPTQADPEQKHLTCSTCGFSGLCPVTAADLARLDSIETRGLHYHFLLERTAPPESEFRSHLEWLHEFYTPRAIYALAEMIMKLEASISNPAQQRIFKAVLLDCLPAAGNFFQHPQKNQLPKHLKIPAPFIERNLWHLFASSLKTWSGPELPFRQTADFDTFYNSPHNHILFFSGDGRKLAENLPAESVALVISQPPLETPLSASLSALWGGWLLGKPNLTSLKHGPFSNQQQANAYWQQTAHRLEPLKFSLQAEAQWRFTFLAQHSLHAPALSLAILKAGYDIEDWRIDKKRHELDLSHIPLAPAERSTADNLAKAVEAEAQAVSLSFSENLSTEAKFLAVWQSLLYSGLLAQVIQTLPADDVWPWLVKRIKTAIV